VNEEERKTLSKILERIRDVCDTKTKFHSENEQDSKTIHRLVEAYFYLKLIGDNNDSKRDV
jgi:hypothetical protein